MYIKYSNTQKNKVMYDCIIYILCYILAYIQHNGDVSLENLSGNALKGKNFICSDDHNKLIKRIWQNEEFLSLSANCTES